MHGDVHWPKNDLLPPADSAPLMAPARSEDHIKDYGGQERPVIHCRLPTHRTLEDLRTLEVQAEGLLMSDHSRRSATSELREVAAVNPEDVPAIPVLYSSGVRGRGSI